MQRYDKRRKTLRRSVIVGVIAVLVVGTGALLFAGGKSPATTTTTTTTTTTGSTTSTSSTTTSTTTTVPVAGQITQALANARAVAAGCPASTAARVNTLTWSKAPAITINKAKTYYAHFSTTAGSFVVKLDAATAPITTNNFVFLARHNYYKCVIFHRAIPGFMIQGGDPTGTGASGPGYTIADEYPVAGNPTYPLYSIAMANQNAAHTGGSQFFIVTGAAGETLPATYSLFGQVISGTRAVEIIQNAGNSSQAANGVPPIVTHRILNVTISEQ
jgi:cyclophilin family peptidyl-prolyl cis-trans isomerase